MRWKKNKVSSQKERTCEIESDEIEWLEQSEQGLEQQVEIEEFDMTRSISDFRNKDNRSSDPFRNLTRNDKPISCHSLFSQTRL